MLTVSLLDWCYGTAAIDHDYSGYPLYLFKAGRHPLYVGQSSNVVARISAHLQRNHTIGRLLFANTPASYQWRITFFTVGEVRERYANHVIDGLDTAERAMIKALYPSLNIAQRYRKRPLPDGLTLPASELPEDYNPLAITAPRWKVSYSLFDWQRLYKRHYRGSVIASDEQAARYLVAGFLGCLPEKTLIDLADRVEMLAG